MKTMLLIIFITLTSSCFAFESKQAEFPTAQMQSVNSFHSMSSYKPQITPVGSTSAYGTATPRRTPNNGIEHGDGGNPNEPYQTPIGDCPIELLIVFGIIYFAIVKIRSNKCKLAESTSVNG